MADYNQIDLRELVRQRWGEGKRSARSTLYKSRWRDDRTPSFVVYPDGWKDFGTGENGGVLDWIAREYGLSIREAGAWLSGQTDTMPAVTLRAYVAPEARDPHEPPSEDWQRAMRAALRECQRHLWSADSTKVLDYLREMRGLSDETIRAAGLGYCPTFFKTDYIDPDQVGKRGAASIAPGIVIPWQSEGQLWALHVRTRTGSFADYLGIPDDTFNFGERAGEALPKYLSARGSKPTGTLYNADAIQPDVSHEILIVEGEFDGLVANQFLPSGAVCVTFGSASDVPATIKPRFASRLLTAKRIYSALDADSAGQKATERLHNSLGALHHPLTLPAGNKDLSDFVVGGGNGAAWFRQATSETIPNSWITALLHLSDGDGKAKGAGAVIYKLLLEAQAAGQVGEYFSGPDLVASERAQARGVTRDLIYAGLIVLSDLGFIDKLSTEKDQQEHAEIKSTNTGRNRQYYRLVSWGARRDALYEALAPRVRELAYPTKGQRYVPATIADLTERALIDAGLDPELKSAIDAASAPAKEQQTAERRYAAKREARISRALLESLDDPTVTPFPEGWAWGSIHQLRVAFLRALKLAGLIGTRHEDTMLALGISLPKTNQFVREAGFAIETNQRAAVAINPHDPNVSPERQVRQGAAAVKGHPLALEVSYDDGEDSKTLPYSGDNLALLSQTHAQIDVIYQIANKHIPLDDVQPLARPLPKRQGGVQRRADKPKPSAEDRHAQRESALERAPKRPGYRRQWVEGQVKLVLAVLGWHDVGRRRYVNPHTGEIVVETAGLAALVGLLVGQ